MPTHRIRCADIEDLRRKLRAARTLYGGDLYCSVVPMVKGTLSSGRELVFATEPIPLMTRRRVGVFCDGGWHGVDLAKSEDVKLWIHVTIHEDNEVR
jgi:hypothetical protein